MNNFAKYTSAGIQMMVIIGVSSYVGHYLDQEMANTKPWLTIGFSLFGIFSSLYLVLKSILNK